MGGGQVPIGWCEAFDRASGTADALSKAGAGLLFVEPAPATTDGELVGIFDLEDIHPGDDRFRHCID